MTEQLKHQEGSVEQDNRLEEAVKARVMSFFEGADLDAPGKYQNGAVMINVHEDDNLSKKWMCAEAEINGMRVAGYMKYPEKTDYTLTGGEENRHIYVSATLTEYADGHIVLSKFPRNRDVDRLLRQWLGISAE